MSKPLNDLIRSLPQDQQDRIKHNTKRLLDEYDRHKERTLSIKATIVADSISIITKSRMTTFEIEFPTFILPQINTHRMLSKNAQSSRAVPVKRMIEMVRTNPFIPVKFGQNQSGMVAGETVDTIVVDGVEKTSKELWLEAAENACETAERFMEAGIHKEVTNRLLGPFLYTKMVISGTEWDNFWHLRIDSDVQPEFQDLAQKMFDVYCESSPKVLQKGSWHTPYYGDGYWTPDCDDSLETAQKTSAACCAQVSYRRLDDSQEKVESIFDMLIKSDKIHASPFEHIAGCVAVPFHKHYSEVGYTHIRCGGFKEDAHMFSGNIRGFVQYRQLLNKHTCWDYEV